MTAPTTALTPPQDSLLASTPIKTNDLKLNETFDTASTSGSSSADEDIVNKSNNTNKTVLLDASSSMVSSIPHEEEENEDDATNVQHDTILQLENHVFQFVGTVGQSSQSVVSETPLATPPTKTKTVTALDTTTTKPLLKKRKSRLSFRRRSSKSTSSVLANDNDDDASVMSLPATTTKTVHEWQPLVAPGTTQPGWVSYYEVSILAPRPLRNAIVIDAAVATNEDDSEPVHEECVSVGLSLAGFDHKHCMPGWTQHSYGYHGDDGHVFLARTKDNATHPTFGVGDVIGCGVNWDARRVFFTKNGHFLGYHSQAFAKASRPRQWFPTVGMDSHVCVQLNLGSEPFVFDLADMVDKVNRKQEMVVSVPSPIVLEERALVVTEEVEELQEEVTEEDTVDESTLSRWVSQVQQSQWMEQVQQSITRVGESSWVQQSVSNLKKSVQESRVAKHVQESPQTAAAVVLGTTAAVTLLAVVWSRKR